MVSNLVRVGGRADMVPGHGEVRIWEALLVLESSGCLDWGVHYGPGSLFCFHSYCLCRSFLPIFRCHSAPVVAFPPFTRLQGQKSLSYFQAVASDLYGTKHYSILSSSESILVSSHTSLSMSFSFTQPWLWRNHFFLRRKRRFSLDPYTTC